MITALKTSDFKHPRYLVETGQLKNEFKSFEYRDSSAASRSHSRRMAGDNAKFVGVSLKQYSTRTYVAFHYQVQTRELQEFSTLESAQRFNRKPSKK